jgi:hypothetical protein
LNKENTHFKISKYTLKYLTKNDYIKILFLKEKRHICPNSYYDVCLRVLKEILPNSNSVPECPSKSFSSQAP